MAGVTSRMQLTKSLPGEKVDIEKLNTNFDKIDANIQNFVCTSTTRPPAPWPGMKIWETDTKQERLYNGTKWILVGGVKPYGKMIHDNGLMNNFSTDTNSTTTITSYPTGLTGGITHNGVPGGLGMLVIPEDGLYRIDMNVYQNGGAVGILLTGLIVNNGTSDVGKIDLIRIERLSSTTDYVKARSFPYFFAKDQRVRMFAWRSGGDAAMGINGSPNGGDATQFSLTFEQ